MIFSGRVVAKHESGAERWIECEIICEKSGEQRNTDRQLHADTAVQIMIISSDVVYN